MRTGVERRARRTAVAGAGAAAVAAGLITYASGGREPAATPRRPPPPASAATEPSPVRPPTVRAVPPTGLSPAPQPPGLFPTPHSPPPVERRLTAPAPPAPATSKAAARPTTPAAPAPAPLRGLLQREDPLPAGVPQQVSFFFGGGQKCAFEVEPGPPDIDLGSEPLIPTEFIVCFYRFDITKPLQVTLSPPAGKPRTATLPRGSAEEGFFHRWPRLPDDPAGAYRISARQRDTEVTETFTVRRPGTPRLWLDTPSGGVAVGGDIHLYLAGFPPDRTVALNLYRFHEYRTSFPVPVDARGGGHAVLRTAPGDPLACWGVSHPDLGDSTEPGGLGPTSTNVFCTVAADGG